ncbi:uncharacterized protein SPSK_03796 [Sporothrix schenckii 1099-18]|uniref:Uncharacterized protein n=1 Tax=Sporothrix schenckii 1099-18 TaxID=1397361 RepID=A0A0F2LZP2_SPOSC|nr:uncharacterized protein SPSK_03796 [Sporothrix schenckii 1099-18]KJR82304.1 hypothetical protein SPSK_03796 [Sporothrix schenckii 1099-18]
MATRSRRKQPTAEEVPEDAEMADASAAAQDEVAAEEEGAEIAEDGGDDEEDEEEETQRVRLTTNWEEEYKTGCVTKET